MVTFAPDMPEADYRAWPLPSWSAVKGLLDMCPAQWRHEQDAPRTESAVMIWGTLLHAAVLEPHRLAEMICEPVTVGRDASGKLWTHTAANGETWRLKEEATTAAQAATPQGRYPVAPALMDDLRQRAAVAAALLPVGALREVALRGSIEGQPCKGKADALGGMTLDVKTTADVSPRAIQRAAIDRHWYGQLWTYGELARQNGHDPGPCVILVVQAPHLTHAGGVLDLADRHQPRAHARLLTLDADAVAHGRREALQAWRTYRDCVLLDQWPDWQDTSLSVPRWAMTDAPAEDVW